MRKKGNTAKPGKMLIGRYSDSVVRAIGEIRLKIDYVQNKRRSPPSKMVIIISSGGILGLIALFAKVLYDNWPLIKAAMCG